MFLFSLLKRRLYFQKRWFSVCKQHYPKRSEWTAIKFSMGDPGPVVVKGITD